MLSLGSASHPPTRPLKRSRPRKRKLLNHQAPLQRQRRCHREPTERPSRRATLNASKSGESTPRLAPHKCCALSRKVPRGKPFRPQPDSRKCRETRKPQGRARHVWRNQAPTAAREVAASTADGTEATRQLRPHRLHCLSAGCRPRSDRGGKAAVKTERSTSRPARPTAPASSTKHRPQPRRATHARHTHRSRVPH